MVRKKKKRKFVCLIKEFLQRNLIEKEGNAMCVVKSFNQLEEAVRKDVREVLVIGRLGDQIKLAITETESYAQSDNRIHSVLRKIQNSYTINCRKNSRCVPVILCQKGRHTISSESRANCDC